MTETVWDITQKALVDAGVDTYPPATYKGDCKAPYCVLRDSGSEPISKTSSERHFYTLLCYVPRNKYLELASFVERCKAVMAQPPIYPMLMPTGTETPSFYDDTNNSYMISIQYRNNVRFDHV